MNNLGCQQNRRGRGNKAAAPGLSGRLVPSAFRLRKRAFTILEVMMAILIFSMVLTAIYSTWLAILKGTKVGGNVAAEVQRSRITLRALEDSLLTVQMYNANLRYYSFVADKESLSLVSRLPASFPGVGRYGDQIVRRVSFYLRSGKDGLNELVMTQAPLLLDLENTEVEPYTIVLAKDVNVFEMQYWDMRKRDWVDEWTLTNNLPKLVQVTLGLGKLGGNSSKPQDVVTRIVALPSVAVMPDLQATFGPGGLQPGMPNQPGALPIPGGQGVPITPPVGSGPVIPQ